MCRWLAYSGTPVLIEELLYKPEHSLIDQSLHSRLGAETTNGDGFGVGWYGEHADTPAVFKSIEPAWNDQNLRELAGHIRSGLVFAHIRASSGTPVEHPIQMTVATSDGDRVWGFRYSSEGKSRSLFFSTRVDTLREMYPDNPVLHGLSDETRIVVSEPLGDLKGAWNEVPESSFGVIQEGQDELHPFTPQPPS